MAVSLVPILALSMVYHRYLMNDPETKVQDTQDVSVLLVYHSTRYSAIRPDRCFDKQCLERSEPVCDSFEVESQVGVT